MRIKQETLRKVSVLVIIFLIVSGVAVLKSFKDNSARTPSERTETSEKDFDFKLLSPGESSKEDVINEFGEPLNTENIGNNELLEYPSKSNYRQHEILIEEEKVTLIKKAVTAKDEINTQDLIQEYGEAEYKLYNKAPNSPFYLYVYPEKGKAYWGHEDGTLLEIWYFPSTDIDDFINNWASDWQKEPSNIQQY